MSRIIDRSLSILIAIAVFLIGYDSSARGDALEDRPLFATLDGTDLYVAVRKPEAHDQLIRAPLDGGAIVRFEIPTDEVRIPPRPQTWYSLRWRIRDEYLWCLDAYHPLAEGLPYHPTLRVPVTSLFPTTTPKEEWSNLWWVGTDEGWGPIHHENLDHTRDFSQYFGWPSRHCPILEAAHRERREFPVRDDIVPTGVRSCVVFVLNRDASMSVSKYEFKAVAREGGGKLWVGTWSEPEVISFESTEPFYAIVGSGAYHFVTQSGTLWHASKMDWRARKVAIPGNGDGENPIQAVISDAQSQKTYAFTPASFFEISDKLEPRPFDLGPLENVKPDDPLPTVRRCALALRAVVPAAKQADGGRKP